MTLTLIETIIIISFIISLFIGLYFTYKCFKGLKKYKVRIQPYKIETSPDNLPA